MDLFNCLHGWYGQTVGKMITKVKVVGAKTEVRISFRHAVLRDSSLRVASTCIGKFRGSHSRSDELTFREWTTYGIHIWLVAEFITMLTNDKRRAIHDLIAGTVVVRTNIEELAEDTLERNRK